MSPLSNPFKNFESVGYIGFDQNAVVEHGEARLHWNDEDKTLEIGTDIENVHLQIGQEQYVRAYNKTGSDIGNGKAVFVNSVFSDRPTISLADPEAFSSSAVIGLLTSDILNDGVGFVTTFGLVRDIDTSGISTGLVWLSSVAGELTNDRPDTFYQILIGYCIKSDAEEGIIFVNIQDFSGSESQIAGSFLSPSGLSGTFYADGFYRLYSGNNNFSSPANFGTANSSYAAHFFVVLGESAVDDITLRISGVSINDNGERNASDTQDIVIPSGSEVNSYFETPKKWLGQVTITLISGTAKNCNYGFCKYWDNNNSDFIVTGLEFTWRAGANDTGADLMLLHHKSTGWTYNAGSVPTPPDPIAKMSTDHTDADNNLISGENGAWKRANLENVIYGSQSEGIIIKIITTANKAFETGNSLIRIRQL